MLGCIKIEPIPPKAAPGSENPISLRVRKVNGTIAAPHAAGNRRMPI